MSTPSTEVRIWDLPTRLFHWTLALCVIALVVTANVGGNAMVWHLRLGHTVLALLLFRLCWGLVGGRWSRFGAFLYRPARLVAYLRGRGQESDEVGHSPLGALSVFAMLAALLAQASTGLFADDEIAFSGPLTHLVSNTWVSNATGYHTQWGKLLVLLLVVMHLLAVAVYVWRKKRPLVRAMWRGDKQLPATTPAARDDGATRLGALLLALGCAALSWWIASLASL